MHVLTKVFIVMAALLSVALSALTIAYAINTDRIAADYRGMMAARDAANASLAAQASQAAQQQTRDKATIDSLNTEKAQLIAQITSLQSERVGLQTSLKKAESERDAISGKIAELGETARTQASLIDSYRKEVTTLRSNELTYRQRALEMEDRLSDLESQREVLEQNYRALQEELAQIKQQQAQQLAGGGAAAGEDKPYVFAGPPIFGRVEEVRKDPATNGTLVRINVGTNDRVAKNMKFIVVRNGQYVGNVVVTQPDMRWSVAVVNLLLNKSDDVKVGDQIQSSAS